jgi:phosphatidylethanolamine/phosphatidyl-N-methylethanolamine N-methyltransferase
MKNVHSQTGNRTVSDALGRPGIRSVILEHVKFLSTFAQGPVRTGALAPSSRWLATRMTEGLELEQAEVVVELGPGTGAFTRVIEKQLRPEALLLAVEINPDFAALLKQKFPRAHVVHGSAERLDEHLARLGRTSVDCVLSGLPWAGFSRDLQERLLTPILKTLRPGGRFATFAYSHAAWLPRGQEFRRLLEAHFAQVRTTRIVWRNLPPAFVYHCEKR